MSLDVCNFHMTKMLQLLCYGNYVTAFSTITEKSWQNMLHEKTSPQKQNLVC